MVLVLVRLLLQMVPFKFNSPHGRGTKRSIDEALVCQLLTDADFAKAVRALNQPFCPLSKGLLISDKVSSRRLRLAETDWQRLRHKLLLSASPTDELFLPPAPRH